MRVLVLRNRSGSTYAYSVLDEGYRDGMSLEEAADLAKRAVRHATYRDAFSGEVPHGAALAVEGSMSGGFRYSPQWLLYSVNDSGRPVNGLLVKPCGTDVTFELFHTLNICGYLIDGKPIPLASTALYRDHGCGARCQWSSTRTALDLS